MGGAWAARDTVTDQQSIGASRRGSIGQGDGIADVAELRGSKARQEREPERRRAIDEARERGEKRDPDVEQNVEQTPATRPAVHGLIKAAHTTDTQQSSPASIAH